MVVYDMPVEFIAGWPWFYWLVVLTGILAIAYIFTIIVIRWLAGPTWGYVIARLQKKENAGIIITSDNIEIRPVDYLLGVFEALGLAWLDRAPRYRNFGGMNGVLVYDRYKQVLDPAKLLAIKEYIQKWNDEHAEDKITNYVQLQDRLRGEKINSLIEIKAIDYVPVSELLDYLSPDNAGELSGAIQHKVNLRAKNQNAVITPWWVYLICIIAGAGIALLATGMG